MSEGITEQQLLDSTSGIEREIAEILLNYNVLFHNRARLDACKKIAALISEPLTHVPGCRCTTGERDPMCDDPGLCKNADCPVGSTIIGWPHPIDAEGCLSGQLDSGAAYDFNNLLTVISGYSSLLLQRLPAVSSHRPEVEEIKRAADRAIGLVRQLPAAITPPVLQLQAADFLRSLIPRLCELCREGKRPVQMTGQRKNGTLSFTHFNGFKHVLCAAADVHDRLNAGEVANPLRSYEFCMLMGDYSRARETDEAEAALDAIRVYILNSFLGLVPNRIFPLTVADQPAVAGNDG